VKCPKCGGNHEFRNCNIEKPQYKCPNCGQNHAAWSSLCPHVKQHLNEKKEKEIQRALKAPENQPVTRKLMQTFSHAVQSTMHNVEENTNKHLASTDALKASLEQNTVTLMNTMISLQNTIIERIDFIHKDLVTLQRHIMKETTQQLDSHTLTNKALTIDIAKQYKIHHEKLIHTQEAIHQQINQLIQNIPRARDHSKERHPPPPSPKGPKPRSNRTSPSRNQPGQKNVKNVDL
jgi:hypothetical protein